MRRRVGGGWPLLQVGGWVDVVACDGLEVRAVECVEESREWGCNLCRQLSDQAVGDWGGTGRSWGGVGGRVSPSRGVMAQESRGGPN